MSLSFLVTPASIVGIKGYAIIYTCMDAYAYAKCYDNVTEYWKLYKSVMLPKNNNKKHGSFVSAVFTRDVLCNYLYILIAKLDSVLTAGINWFQ